jgi:hypothetical protein
MDEFSGPQFSYAKAFVLLIFYFAALASHGFALGQPRYVENNSHPGYFTIAKPSAVTSLYVDGEEYSGVVRAAADLKEDINRVTGQTAIINKDPKDAGLGVILIGTIGKSRIIDGMIRDKKIDVSAISGKWESFLIQTVSKPLPGVSNALVIAGSDKRGTIYGIYDLSEQIGVSPWYWWADVPVQHKDSLYVKPGKYVQGPPAVKYRGIFLNDEAPALTGWVTEKFGGYNHQFYEKVFELILRLKGNYLWPAMWGSAFNEDDPMNPKLADEYGIVMGTSHHEPMLRAQQEWKRHGTGPWDYSKNEEVLKKFWTEGVERNKNYESITTLAMRGDGDMPMSESANIELLEKIVDDQRKIIAEHVNPDLTQVPQDWALYKEVQEYYEKGMRVPDDVTLLWCDDNWGNIRRLPTEEERKRSGGAGIYYHFDYVGDPRSYKWLNTNPITKVWEQMNLAYHYDANRIWIVNVGDLKPMEFPIEFFLTFAWNPEKWPKEKISDYTKLWATREFGPKYAADIADIISKYTKYNGRRKPELLEPDTYSLVDYQEADRVLADWKALAEKAERIYALIPEESRDAYFQLVLYPAKASAQVAELYIAVGKNQLYVSQNRASANVVSAQATALFKADADLANLYNRTLAHSKWNHMMDQTHIGYTSWRDPETNVMPKVTDIDIPNGADLGVAIEGSASAWAGASGDAVLPGFDVFNRQRRYIDVFNRGRAPLPFSAATSAPWIVLSNPRGVISKEERIWVSVDWQKAPKEVGEGEIKITGAGDNLTIKVKAFNPKTPSRDALKGFVEGDGYVSIEAEHYTKKVDADTVRWEKIADHGRTLSAMSIFPVTAASVTPPQNAPCLEYQMYLFDPKTIDVEAIVSPTLNFVPGRGLRYAVSFDDQPPQVIDVLEQNTVADWSESVKDSVRKSKSSHTVSGSGYHTLKFWMVDPGLVLQKLVVDLGGVKPSYLGPPESYHSISLKPVAKEHAPPKTKAKAKSTTKNTKGTKQGRTKVKK